MLTMARIVSSTMAGHEAAEQIVALLESIDWAYGTARSY